MAEPATAAPTQEAAPSISSPAMPNEVLGIMQRLLRELDAYCSQPVEYVQPAVCYAYLERVYQWVQQLPAPQQQASAPESKKAN